MADLDKFFNLNPAILDQVQAKAEEAAEEIANIEQGQLCSEGGVSVEPSILDSPLITQSLEILPGAN